MIGFDPKFLIDALKVIDDEQVEIKLLNSKAPCFIKDNEETYTYLILPVTSIKNLGSKPIIRSLPILVMSISSFRLPI